MVLGADRAITVARRVRNRRGSMASDPRGRELGLVAQARSEGLLDPEEFARIEGALALRTLTAADAMRPWSQITTVPADVSPAYVEVLASRTGRSRFPVVHAASRRVVGFVHVKDDIYDYASDAAEEAGRDEPNEADMLSGIRRLVDAAMEKERA